MLDTTLDARVQLFLDEFDAALAAGDIDAVVAMFATECYWRDLVAFSWNIITVEGHDGISSMLRATLRSVQPRAWRVDGEATAAGGLTEAWFTFETAVGRGKGHVRLIGDRAVTLLTTLDELKGHEERSGATRERGVEHRATPNRRTWLDLRQAEEAALGTTVQP